MQNTVAIRRYDLDEYQCADTLYWIGPDFYRLHKTSNHPEEAQSEWETLNAWGAEEWLRDCPEQIFPPSGSALVAWSIKKAVKRAVRKAERYFSSASPAPDSPIPPTRVT